MSEFVWHVGIVGSQIQVFVTIFPPQYRISDLLDMCWLLLNDYDSLLPAGCEHSFSRRAQILLILCALFHVLFPRLKVSDPRYKKACLALNIFQRSQSQRGAQTGPVRSSWQVQPSVQPGLQDTDLWPWAGRRRHKSEEEAVWLARLCVRCSPAAPAPRRRRHRRRHHLLRRRLSVSSLPPYWTPVHFRPGGNSPSTRPGRTGGCGRPAGWACAEVSVRPREAERPPWPT